MPNNSGWDFYKMKTEIPFWARLPGLAIGIFSLLTVVSCEKQPGRPVEPETTGEAEMKIESSAFNHIQTIPQKYSGEGQDLSPALSWSQLPEGANMARTQQLLDQVAPGIMETPGVNAVIGVAGFSLIGGRGENMDSSSPNSTTGTNEKPQPNKPPPSSPPSDPK